MLWSGVVISAPIPGRIRSAMVTPSLPFGAAPGLGGPPGGLHRFLAHRSALGLASGLVALIAGSARSGSTGEVCSPFGPVAFRRQSSGTGRLPLFSFGACSSGRSSVSGGHG